MSNAINIMQSGCFHIAGIYDIKGEAAQNFAERFRVRRYESVAAMLEIPSVQAVCITVPNSWHPEMVRLAADAGKHVFVEKPLASYPDECDALGKYCEERNVILQIGHQVRREPVFREIARLIREGPLGTPLFFQGVYTLLRKDRRDWRSESALCPGGSMEQLGVHFIDVLVALFGEPKEFTGGSGPASAQAPVAPWLHVCLTFHSGVRGIVSTSFSCPNHKRLEFFFERGGICTDGTSLNVRFGDSRPEMHKPKGRPGGVVQFEEFADCIEHGGVPETNAAAAAAVMRVVELVHPHEGA